MKLFESNEIFLFAMRIEENGEAFYRKAARMAQEKALKDTFTYLANEEIEHRKTFERMLSKLEKVKIDESYPGEYLAYLRDYLDGKVIFDQKATDQESVAVTDTLSAIDFAIQRELNSILYYQEVKKFVTKNQQESIENIIEEERKHFAQLTDLKKDCAKSP